MMVDLSLNAIIPAVVGPLLVFILAYAGWATRRLYVKHVEEIKNMALDQKEFDKTLLKVLLQQSKFDDRLESGFERIGADMDNMKTNIAGLQSELREHRAVMDKEIALIRERIGRNGAG